MDDREQASLAETLDIPLDCYLFVPDHAGIELDVHGLEQPSQPMGNDNSAVVQHLGAIGAIHRVIRALLPVALYGPAREVTRGEARRSKRFPDLLWTRLDVDRIAVLQTHFTLRAGTYDLVTRFQI